MIVIGGGPGGYVAAIRAAQLGKKTAVVEMDKPGGRCLNYACIPAKTILHSAELYDHAKNGAELGITAKDVTVDWDALEKRRAGVSETLSNGVQMLWKKNKIDMIEGEGSLTPDANVAVGDATYEAGTVVLATGSAALAIPGSNSATGSSTRGAPGRCRSSRSRSPSWAPAHQAPRSPPPTGASGTEVTLIEMLDQILPAEDKDMARVVERTFKKQGITISTGTPVESVDSGKKSVKVKYGDTEIEVDYLCIAGGRAPDTEALNLEAAGVKTTDGGKIEVDDYQRTSNPKVYAIGDLVGRKALAHKASEEGVVAVEHAAGVETHPVDENLVAGATFCQPQVASVGLTEAQAKEAGHDVKIGKQKLGGVGAAPIYDDRDGLVKLVVDSEYGEILGAHIVGNRACDMIPELVNTMALEGGYQELARIVHPHPTMSEAVLDAARAVDGWAIHS